MAYPKLIENLIEKLMKLPGIGRRSAERIVFYFLNSSRDEIKDFCDDVLQLKDGLRFCRICNNLSETEICLICSDTSRDDRTICVVENPKDLLAIEKTGAYKGHYHILLGAISPADGRGPDDLKIHQLIRRVQSQNIKEVVLATDPDTEGETTAMYITRELKDTNVKISRIGLGIPVGSSLEYADLSTLSMSLSSRRQIRD
ncbi:MAG TPA: recombination mediator RecR [Candidatus Omnitrophota bacterium]|nr:recombination mediator RecR [Candidatus Omnitrophota bacterium]HPD85677.1 recombination mediator RecR [Candidatus Omnitrophota bacterium]HRZ04520.1 recombination mediator RecR [Candidatus Omnitrophota bacterium]